MHGKSHGHTCAGRSDDLDGEPEFSGRIGTLAEFRVERWLREAMILPIWEGTPHRQILDALEVMERKHAHRLLFQHLAPFAHPQALEEIAARVEDHLALPIEEREAKAEKIFRDLAAFTANALCNKPSRDEAE